MKLKLCKKYEMIITWMAICNRVDFLKENLNFKHLTMNLLLLMEKRQVNVENLLFWTVREASPIVALTSGCLRHLRIITFWILVLSSCSVKWNANGKIFKMNFSKHCQSSGKP